MIFNLAGLNPAIVKRAHVVGNVYAARGGRAGSTRVWVLVATTKDAGKLLGVDEDGRISSTQSYYLKALDNMPLIGRCEGVCNLNLEVTPI